MILNDVAFVIRKELFAKLSDKARQTILQHFAQTNESGETPTVEQVIKEEKDGWYFFIANAIIWNTSETNLNNLYKELYEKDFDEHYQIVVASYDAPDFEGDTYNIIIEFPNNPDFSSKDEGEGYNNPWNIHKKMSIGYTKINR